MSYTQIPDNAKVQQWEEDYFEDWQNKDWFSKFVGTEDNAMIQAKEVLTRRPGESITIHLRNAVVAEALGQNDTYEGNEREVKLRTHQITIREYGLPLKWRVYDEQLTGIGLRDMHKSALMDWNIRLNRDHVIEALGSIDGKAYAAASEAEKDAWLTNNLDRVVFGSAAPGATTDHSAGLGGVDNTVDKVTPQALSKMKFLAKRGTPKVRPSQPRKAIEQSDTFVAFVNSFGMADLKSNADFLQANREARQRGSNNPIFNSADFIYDNIPIYEIEDLPLYEGVGAGGINVSPVYLCGAQAIGQVWAKRPETVTEMFDFKRQNGIAIKQWYKTEKLRFGTGSNDTDNTKDHGVVTGYFAAVA